MSKPLDPEIKAMRALVRATEPLEKDAEKRVLEWFIAFRSGRMWIDLPAFTDEATNTPKPKEAAL